MQCGRRPRSTIADTTAARSPDLVDRRFIADRPDEVSVTNITYVSNLERWLYVALVLDVSSRVIVGWQIATHLRTELVLDAIEMAIGRRDTANGLTRHSDAGCQFTRYRYTERLADAGIAASIGSVGDSYHNAMAEALTGTYTAELIRRGGPSKTRHQAEFATIEWIDWHNTIRLHGEIGHIPPLDNEAHWRASNNPAMMATTQTTWLHATPGVPF